MARCIQTLLVGLAAGLVFSATIAAKDTQKKADSDISFIQVGHISRIDAKNHAVMLLVPKDKKDEPEVAPPSRLGGLGRIGRMGRIGGPAAEQAARQLQRSVETKVLVNSGTVFKDSEGALRFEDLGVGDFIEVDGVMHGNDFQAKQLLRHSKKSDSQKKY